MSRIPGIPLLRPVKSIGPFPVATTLDPNLLQRYDVAWAGWLRMRRLAVAAQSSVVSERFSEGLVFMGLFLCGDLSKYAIPPTRCESRWLEFEEQPVLASIIILINFHKLLSPSGMNWGRVRSTPKAFIERSPNSNALVTVASLAIPGTRSAVRQSGQCNGDPHDVHRQSSADHCA